MVKRREYIIFRNKNSRRIKKTLICLQRVKSKEAMWNIIETPVRTMRRMRAVNNDNPSN